MPIVKRRGEAGGEPSAKRAKASSSTKRYRVFGKLGYQEDRYHSIYRSIPDELEDLCSVLAREISSLLNTAGGIVCFGARPSGTVYGDRIRRKEEDKIKLMIDEVFKRFRPIVKTSQYRVTFTPVDSRHESDLAVVEIRVQPGSHGELYENFNHEAYLRRGAVPYGPLTPHEIKKHTVQQLRQRLKDEHSLGLLVQSPATRSKTRALVQAQAHLNKSAEKKKPNGRPTADAPATAPLQKAVQSVSKQRKEETRKPAAAASSQTPVCKADKEEKKDNAVVAGHQVSSSVRACSSLASVQRKAATPQKDERKNTHVNATSVIGKAPVHKIVRKKPEPSSTKGGVTTRGSDGTQAKGRSSTAVASRSTAHAGTHTGPHTAAPGSANRPMGSHSFRIPRSRASVTPVSTAGRRSGYQQTNTAPHQPIVPPPPPPPPMYYPTSLPAAYSHFNPLYNSYVYNHSYSQYAPMYYYA